jgi:hypothetical protein
LLAERSSAIALRPSAIVDVKWGFRKLTVGKFDKGQVSGIAV